MKILFLSDVHLGSGLDSDEKRKDKLLTFLREQGSSFDKIIFNGDLFDFWFEYKHVMPKEYFDVLIVLQELVRSGVKIVYVAGNHDFWMKDFFPEKMNIPIYKDEYTFTVEGKKFWIYHGDGISKKDRGYRLMKKIFRSRINIFLYGLMHPDWGIALAKAVSKLSRKRSRNKVLHDEEDYREYAAEIVKRGYDYVVLGHRHKPEETEMANGARYVNLGDWLTHFTYAVFENGSLHLQRLNPEE